jgi:hypothetical protein
MRATLHPIVKAFLTFWEAMVKCKSVEAARRSILAGKDEFILVCRNVEPRFRKGFLLEFSAGCCPSFYDVHFYDPPAVLGDSLAALVPKIHCEDYVFKDCVVLDDDTGKLIKKDVHLHVISVDPLLYWKTAKQFKFCTSDEGEHSKYLTFNPRNSSNIPCGVEQESW